MNKNASVGKIARLPESIREQLNQRLSNGAMGKVLVSWLNSLPEVNQVMADHFGARPITHQNISEWRHHGYQDWLRQKETESRVLRLAERFKDRGPEESLRNVGALIVAQLTDSLQQSRDIKDADARWRRVQRICWEFARIQKIGTYGMALRLQQEKTLATCGYQPVPPA